MGQKQLPELVQNSKWYYNDIPCAVELALGAELIDDSESEAFALWVHENYWDRDEEWQKGNLEDLAYDFHEQFLSADGVVAYAESLINTCYADIISPLDKANLSQYVSINYRALAEDLQASGEIVVLEGYLHNYVFEGNI